jgi:hypothetical protein
MSENTERVKLAVEREVAPRLEENDRALHRLKLWGGTLAGLVVAIAAAFAYFGRFELKANVEKARAEARAEAKETHARLDAGVVANARDIAVLQVQQATTERNFEWLRLQVTEIAKATRARRVPGSKEE